VASASAAKATGSAVIRPAIRPDFASRTTNAIATALAGPAFLSSACTLTVFAAMSGTVCTWRKCGVPERMSSTESKIPGM
jgi:hypothetical protein